VRRRATSGFAFSGLAVTWNSAQQDRRSSRCRIAPQQYDYCHPGHKDDRDELRRQLLYFRELMRSMPLPSPARSRASSRAGGGQVCRAADRSRRRFFIPVR
jgi:hypothetical protein